MQGSSRASLAAGRERLDTATSARGSEPMELADDLLAVTGLLDGHASLRRALTDPGRDAETRTAALTGLLSGKVSQESVKLAGELVAMRWSQAGDLADALELLAVGAVVIAAEQDGVLESLEDELFRFERTVDGNRGLRDALADRRADPQAKAVLVSALLQGKATAATVHLARQAVLSPRGRRLDQCLELYLAEAAARREQTVAHATVASTLSPAQHDRLVAALSAMFGRPVQLNVDVDPTIIGGIRIEVGDEIVDGSILGRLDEARRRLAG
jgi:F-type H+-transporting ATPase subunit delta